MTCRDGENRYGVGGGCRGDSLLGRCDV